MRKYDKKVEADLERRHFKNVSNAFISPILVDYPECTEEQLMLFNFLNGYGTEELSNLYQMGLIETGHEFVMEIFDPIAGRKLPCGITVEKFVFPCNGMKAVLYYDHGLIATKKWLGFPSKWIHFSRYRIELFHSDGMEAEIDDMSDEQLAKLLEAIKADVAKRQAELEQKHNDELADVLAVEKVCHEQKTAFDPKTYYEEMLQDPTVKRIFKERHGYELDEKGTGNEPI